MVARTFRVHVIIPSEFRVALVVTLRLFEMFARFFFVILLFFFSLSLLVSFFFPFRSNRIACWQYQVFEKRTCVRRDVVCTFRRDFLFETITSEVVSKSSWKLHPGLFYFFYRLFLFLFFYRLPCVLLLFLQEWDNYRKS